MLHGLRGDAAELGEVELVHVLVVLHRHLAAHPVDRDDELLSQPQALPSTLSQRVLQRAKHHILGNVLVGVDDLDHP